METNYRNGVLGLDTAKQVMITFLILSTIGIAILLALTSLQTATTNTIDTTSKIVGVTNETGSVNTTGYILSGFNTSWSGITINALWNQTYQNSGYNVSLLVTNATVNNLLGNVTNASTTQYNNVSISYSYTYTYSLGRTRAIVGNVTNGITTFFASTGTIFSILIVVVIILAISIIIWAVGRFGSQEEQQQNINL